MARNGIQKSTISCKTAKYGLITVIITTLNYLTLYPKLKLHMLGK